MKKLLNTLYVTSENAYLALDGETVQVLFEDGTKRSIPIITLESIVCFSYKGASPALMGKCAENNIALTFFSPRNKYLASTSGSTNGNVLLRKAQYRISETPDESLPIAENFIIGKLFNSKYVLERALRDHPLQIDTASVEKASANIKQYLLDIETVQSVDSLRGIEGNAAAEYFGVFNELILQNKADFVFSGRNKRPPTDPVNALLSFAYTLLERDCSAALFGVGLDPYIGFMHSDRPGRRSLALDLEEEFRSVFADRFVLTLINNRMLLPGDFDRQPSGAVLLTEGGRKTFLSEWQKRKKEEISHPFLNEKVMIGLVPHIQAMLLARFIRGDLDGYPPFLKR